MKTNTEIENLIPELRGKDAMQRIQARKKLVEIGKPATPFLINLLNDPVEHVKWEACKALGSIKDPTAAGALVLALVDKSISVQWLAAEALIGLKSNAVIPLLRSLKENFDSLPLRQGAHHVLHALERENLLTEDTIAVVESLRSLEPVISVAMAAQRALDSVEKSD
jgi:HEAT repeat protein